MEKQILKYMDLMPDEMTKHIMTSIYGRTADDEKKDVQELKRELAQELGVKLITITTKMKHAFRIIHQEIEKERKEEFERYVVSCYDEDGCLSLEKIAKEKGLEVEKLKQIFQEYSDSLTREDVAVANRFGFSLEALKLGNVQVLNHRVKGFSKVIDSSRITSNPDLIVKMERQFLKYIDTIISDVEMMRKENSNQKILN